MTDTTTVDQTPDSDDLPELVESESLGADAAAPESPLKTRIVLPFLVPLLSIAIVAVLVLNISRVFLAGDKDGALVTGIVITLSILVGATILAAAPRLRTSTMAVILGGMLVFVSGAGLVSLGPSLKNPEAKGGGGSVYVTGKPVSNVSVEALASIKFNATTFSAKPGIVQFNYGGANGHTLAIQDPKFNGFLLTTNAGGRKTGKVDMPPGTYTLYCTVPGHEAQGMKATLTVAK